MKLCYVANTRFPSERAHSVQIVQMCNAFAAEGEVILAVTDRETSIVESPASYYGQSFNFTLTRIPVWDSVRHTRSLPDWVQQFLYSVQRCMFAYRTVRAVRSVDMYYGRDEVVLFLIGCLCGFKNIALESHEAKYNWLVRYLVRNKVPVVVISEGILDFYLDQGVPREQMLVAHDGIDESFFAPPVTTSAARDRLGLPRDARIAMYIGGFDTWKGTDTFFAASNLADDILWVAIGGSEKEIGALQEKYPKVVFLGPQPYRDLVYNQQAADVLVVPNTAKNKLSAEYTSPLKLFAHMTARKPLVLSDIPSLRAVVPTELGYYVTPDDPSALAKAVQSALADETAASEKGLALYELSKKYTWDNRAQEIIDFVTL